MHDKKENPFNLTYSAHMSDEEINRLWVELSIADINKVRNKHSVIVTGGKGCGKTHLMRYHSFPLQRMRHTLEGLSDGIKEDGYVGVYMRCGGLMASRFSGKGYNNDVWDSLFEYSLELYLAEQLLSVVSEITQSKQFNETLCRSLSELIEGSQPKDFISVNKAKSYIKELRKNLDSSINNCVFGESLVNNPSTKIRINRGDLIFKIPKLLSDGTQLFNSIYFIYLIDELENFTESQQRFVNTLMREMTGPVAIKFGVRKYGIRTTSTLSANEDLIEGSDYERLPLDEQLRNNDENYKKFSYNVLRNRLSETEHLSQSDLRKWAQGLFETISFDWCSSDIVNLTAKRIKQNARLKDSHMQTFKQKLQDSGINAQEAYKITNNLRFPDYPLLEKTNTLSFYKNIGKISSLRKLSEELKDECEALINEKRGTQKKYESNRIFKIWDHYKNDITDQYLKDYNMKPYYVGVDKFIEMSEGMPRNYINILKHIYNWAIFQDDTYESNGFKFSLNVQQKAVQKASEWAFDDLRRAGKDLQPLQASTRRLAKLFQINHYADKPSECSLISFATDLTLVSGEAQRLINIAENRSLLVGQKSHQDKNDGTEKSKFRLSKMLCPLWDLPIAQRGTIEIPPEDIDIIFNPILHSEKDFKTLVKKWESKRQLVSFIQQELF